MNQSQSALRSSFAGLGSGYADDLGLRPAARSVTGTKKEVLLSEKVSKDSRDCRHEGAGAQVHLCLCGKPRRPPS